MVHFILKYSQSQFYFMLQRIFVFILFIGLFTSCKKESTTTPTYNLVFKFKFDSTQQRLNGLGQPSVMPAGHAGQHPLFNEMSAHYIELAPTATTQLGQGAILYKATETTAGGESAIDFSNSNKAGNGSVFYTIPISSVTKGTYEWLRISLAYQNYDVKYRVDTTISGFNINQENTGTIASFIGFNTYISSFKIKDQTVLVHGNRKQGFWGFESAITVGGTSYPLLDSAQAPAGATTVVNPISATSPIPAGSCVVTAQIKPGKLTITGNETNDIVVEVSLSTNKSFEWQDNISNGKWEPLKGEKVVDMGIRGMIPTVQ